ncbi:hypothetical protein Ppa06_33690 [Planomonospora parontospora subsp. parontospora]|uniref:Uncharacterized protein n=2 Tax=Planomonospora parontospora TaxID=58119 RepID=A0AA37F589_9ACTN|nr:hypothetical protein [Planomonospora parontospora]GGK74470.1 hypothetical protein GCM10010126_37390 [Planomonospora parontospora]GII09571.1 hypothetical protein Ppa06_33690 [Planomonospora parontospora subsp. parontospora]
MSGASRLGLVERWFAELTDERIRRGVHRSVQALEKDIRIRITTWNEDPKPFVRTRTGEETFGTLTSCCRRTTDSAH